MGENRRTERIRPKNEEAAIKVDASPILAAYDGRLASSRFQSVPGLSLATDIRSMSVTQFGSVLRYLGAIIDSGGALMYLPPGKFSPDIGHYQIWIQAHSAY